MNAFDSRSRERTLSRLLQRAAAGFALFLAASTPALAQDNRLQVAPSEIVLSQSTWRFHEDATQQQEVQVQRRALTDQGALIIGRQSFSFNKDLEQLEIL